MARGSFCPVIRVKCSRKFRAAKDPGGLMAGRARTASKYATFKSKLAEARKQLRKGAGLGNVPPLPWQTSMLAPTSPVVKQVAHAKANPATKCTVRMGGKTWKVSGAKVGAKIAELMRAQRAGGCCSPKVQRG